VSIWMQAGISIDADRCGRQICRQVMVNGTDTKPQPVVASANERALKRFLALTVWDVEAEAVRRQRRSATGTTWVGLANLMRRQGYRVVGDLGIPAAASWAAHLGWLDAPGA
jgi:hypothetical protein